MDRVILPFKNGKVILSNEKWCRLSVLINDKLIHYGCDIRRRIYTSILDNMQSNSNPILNINDVPFKCLAVLSDPHTVLYMSENLNKKIVIVTNNSKIKLYKNTTNILCMDFDKLDNSEQIPFEIELSKEDYIVWKKILTHALNKTDML